MNAADRLRSPSPSCAAPTDVHQDRAPPAYSRASARIICSCSTSSTFDESFRNTLPITMRRGRTFRSGRTRPADGQSNNSEILSRIQSLADYSIDTLESSFQKRQPTGADDDHEQAERQVYGDDLADAVEAGAGAPPVL